MLNSISQKGRRCSLIRTPGFYLNAFNGKFLWGNPSKMTGSRYEKLSVAKYRNHLIVTMGQRDKGYYRPVFWQ